MLNVIENFEINPQDWGFLSLSHTERTHDQSFLIRDNLRINFEHGRGGRVALSAIKPKVSAAHYRIRPIDMGAASWYSIEYELAGDHLKNINQVIPCLDAASAQSVTLFAVLRIFYADGRSEDISSSQVELRRSRSKQSFPISLGDQPNLEASKITAGRLIYFIEARNVAIDLYGMTVATVAVPKAEYNVDHVKHLHAAQKAGTQSLHVRSMNPDLSNLWIGETSEHRPIVPNVFLDFQPGEGRKMVVSRRHNSLDIDFSGTASGGWRNLEFRFDNIHNTGSISALLHARGSSTSDKGHDVSLVLREYDEDFSWQDTHISVPLRLFTEDHSELRVVDLSPILSDKREVHCFGILAFLPPETEVLKIEEMDVFVFDQKLV